MRLVPGDPAQVMNDVSASQNQNAVFSQRPNLPPKFEMLFETAPLIETQLKRRHVRVRIHVPEHAPRPMIQSPFFIWHNFRIARHFPGFYWRSGRRIFYFIKLSRKSVEIMDRLRSSRRQHMRSRSQPMRRHHAHCLRPGQARAQIAQRRCKRIVLNRVHRRSMTYEEHWHLVQRKLSSREAQKNASSRR